MDFFQLCSRARSKGVLAACSGVLGCGAQCREERKEPHSLLDSSFSSLRFPSPPLRFIQAASSVASLGSPSRNASLFELIPSPWGRGRRRRTLFLVGSPAWSRGTRTATPVLGGTRQGLHRMQPPPSLNSTGKSGKCPHGSGGCRLCELGFFFSLQQLQLLWLGWSLSI